MSQNGTRKYVNRYKHLAKKNTFCFYLAAILIVVSVFCEKFYKYNRRRMIACAQIVFIVSTFLLNSSFTPPRLTSDGKEPTGQVVIRDSEGVSDEESNQVNLEDLMAKTDIIAEEETEKNVVSLNSEPAFHKDDWNLLLVNKQHKIPEDYTFTLGTLKGSMQCDERIIEPLTRMFAAAKEDGVNLIVCSPYRDISRQEYLFKRKISNYEASGLSYIEAYKEASTAVTVPGASEHQIGLAVDIISDKYSQLDWGFENTTAGKWLKEHSKEYGFILRYPRGKEDITGIMYEPWHFRYVGKEAATVIMDENITLEEFVESL